MPAGERLSAAKDTAPGTIGEGPEMMKLRNGLGFAGRMDQSACPVLHLLSAASEPSV
jgi:hypothetical protein